MLGPPVVSVTNARVHSGAGLSFNFSSLCSMCFGCSQISIVHFLDPKLIADSIKTVQEPYYGSWSVSKNATKQHFPPMTSQISGPCCDSDIKTSIRVQYGKVTFGNKFSSSLKMFIVKGNKIQLGFDNKYPENNQRVPRQR